MMLFSLFFQLMKRSVITSDFEKRHSVPSMYVSQYARRKEKKVTSVLFNG